MEEVKIFLPKLGESILNATVVRWFKKEGEEVEIDEPLLEVTTDKVNSEIPSPVKGILKEIIANENEELRVGEVLGIITTGEKKASKKELRKEEKKVSKEEKERKSFLSPVAKVLAKKYSLTQEELDLIQKTGSGGRISRRDIEEYLSKKEISHVEQVKMTPKRKAIAKAMTKSSHDIPAASLIVEIDVTDVLKLIKDVKEEFLKKNGVKLTITSFFAKAVTKGILAFPYVNASVKDDTIVVKKDINLGLAVNVSEGLIVPVIKNCEDKSIIDIAKSVALLGEKARTNSLSLEDVQEGTITISNFGMGGALIGIPIIKHPEVAIIGIGTIQKKVVALENGFFAVRDVMMVSLTFDHRIIDGMYGCSFMQEIKEYLEKKAVKDFS